MKKILYIVPILVFAMVALTLDAQAQTQTGNASNAITQGATGAVVNSALTITANEGAGGGNGETITVSGSTTDARTVQAEAPSFKASYGVLKNVDSPTISGSLKQQIANANATTIPGRQATGARVYLTRP